MTQIADKYLAAHNIAGDLLDAVVDEFASAGVDLPEVRFLSNGAVPLDSEMLTVALGRLWGIADSGLPDEAITAQRCVHWRAATFEIILVRCAPTFEDNPLSPQVPVRWSAVAASAKTAMTDPMIVTRGVLTAYRAGAFGEGANLAFEEWAPLGPEGGLVGGVLKVRIGLA